MSSVDLGWLEIERARYESLLDSLTGLPRWSLLIDRTAVALSRARRPGCEVAVFVLDEPRLPHAPYDVLQVVDLLRRRIRPDDTLARIGAHRFAIVCNEIREDQDAAQIARRLVYGAGITCGLGVALGGEQDSPELVIARALIAAVQREPDHAA